MIFKRSRFCLLILLITVCSAFSPRSLHAKNASPPFYFHVDSTNKIDTETKIQNLKTFAKLYGYVRFFHPSDKASAIDWNRFAVYGVRYIKNAQNKSELKNKLENLFYPIAPTVQIFIVDETPPEVDPTLTPENTNELKLVAWQHKGFGFGSYEGYKSIRLNRPHENPATPLFDKYIQPGEVVEKELGKGLAAQIPLSLFSKNGQTLRPKHVASGNILKEKLGSIAVDSLTANSSTLRYANVIIAWNIFQHFYPYFNVVDVRWSDVLRESLVRASKDQNPEDFLKTLRIMVAQLKDGHGTVIPPIDPEQYVRFPFNVELVEGKLIIADVNLEAKKSTCFQQGDIITSINNKSARQWLKEKKQLISGSSQHKTVTALRRLTYGLGEEYKFVLSRPGETVTCKLTQQANINTTFKKPQPFKEVQPNIYYVDLRNLSMEAIEKKVDTLATAKGIIFDLRGYPNSNHEVLQYLSKEDTLHSPRWMIPQYIYPDQENIVGYDTSGRWTLPPKTPYFPGEKVFLSNKNTISYGESVMGMVEHYKLGDIVGQTTAGANGNSTEYTLPGKYRIRWTGMRVLKHDYSQHHLIGIKPTVPVKPTIEDVRTGKDTYIQKAIDLINTSINN